MQDNPAAAPSHAPPFRRVFFLILAFLYLEYAYTYGAKLHDAQFGDLASFYYAAQTTFLHHQSPYAPGALNWGTQALHQTVWPYLYPPPTLLLFAPLAGLSFKAASLLVLGTSQLCILGLLFLLLHLLDLTGTLRQEEVPGEEAGSEQASRGRRQVTAVFLTVYLLSFQPSVVTLMSGQINFYVILLLCLTWYALKQGAAPALSALPLALAIVLKTYPALFLVVLLVSGRGRVAAWAAAYFALLAAVSFLVLPRVVWHDWLVYVLPYGGYTKTVPGLFAPSAVWNQSVNGFVSRLLLDPQTAVWRSPATAKLTAYSLCAVLFGTEIFLSYRLRKQRAGSLTDPFLDVEFALFLLTMYLVAPLSWEHHLVFVLPAAFVAIAHLFSVKESRWRTLWVAGSVFLIAWAIPIDMNSWERHFFHLLLSIKFYAVLALWLFFARWMARLLRNENSLKSETIHAASY